MADRRWGARRYPAGKVIVMDVSGDFCKICDISYQETVEKEDEIARLIAAAPEMLEALQDVVDNMGIYCGTANSIFLKARKALEKAIK